MTDERGALAAELDALKDSGRELDGFTPVRARVSRAPRAVISLRVGASELREITAAAEVLGRNVSEFIRDAALKEARQIRAGINEARDAVLAKPAC